MRIHSDKQWAIQCYQFGLLASRQRYRAGGNVKTYRHERWRNLYQLKSTRDTEKHLAWLRSEMAHARLYKRLWCWFYEHDYFQAATGLYWCRRCKHMERIET
jgi:hypothetical protein